MDIASRKRKVPSPLYGFGNDSDDEGSISSRCAGSYDDDSSSSKKYSRQNHSEIEKRRRDKMNSYITELSAMVPMCNAMSRKLDKLTVLRMAVQHMKSVRGSSSSCKEANYKPSFLSDDELKQLILEAAEGFLFVVTCDRGKVLYVSESVHKILNLSREELVGHSLFDLLHPKDAGKVKEQLSSSDLAPRERLIDAKTGLPVKSEMLSSPSQLSSGARRSFFCRMKTATKHSLKNENGEPGCSRKKHRSLADRKNYVTIHCTGYLKSWPSAKVGLGNDSEDAYGDECNLSCLVAIARVQPSQIPCASGSNVDVKPTEFVSRHAMDGRFTFVDQRATAILGYLPQELLGTSCYEYYHIDDIPQLADSHKAVLAGKEKILTSVYRFRAKNGDFVKLRTKSFCFRNPWTKEVEYIVCTNTLVPPPEQADSTGLDPNAQVVEQDSRQSQVEMLLSQSSSIDGSSKHRTSVPGIPSNARIGAGKIGRLIAEEVMDGQRNGSSPTNILSTTQEASSSGCSITPPLSQAPSETSSLSSALPAGLNLPDMESNSNDFEGSETTAEHLTAGLLSHTSTEARSSHMTQPFDFSPPSMKPSKTPLTTAMMESTISGTASHQSMASLASTSSSQVAPDDDQSQGSSGGGLSQLAQMLSSNASTSSMATLLDRLLEKAASNTVTNAPQQSTSSASTATGGADNDEAAMAVIMSLLEADAGLGGPVDFTDLPWPL
ncbi:protein cycle-like isoform X2 [Ptychodera flava]|uniref:protein cycle-like isoform X2 n=1 Tax=Ptychodera flava TaxID=63121 RepID=UPI00396A691C